MRPPYKKIEKQTAIDFSSISYFASENLVVFILFLPFPIEYTLAYYLWIKNEVKLPVWDCFSAYAWLPLLLLIRPHTKKSNFSIGRSHNTRAYRDVEAEDGGAPREGKEAKG